MKMNKKNNVTFGIYNSDEISAELYYCIDKSLYEVYLNHYYLIEKHVHERSIVFWFGIYFNKCLQETRYKEYNLDFEYNRNSDDVKRTKNFKEGTYPDLILHKRGSNKDNILVLEFKTWWNKNNDRDKKKLEDFLNQDGEYRYKYAASIVLKRKRPEVRISKEKENERESAERDGRG
jgi:hypothetical protein